MDLVNKPTAEAVTCASGNGSTRIRVVMITLTAMYWAYCYFQRRAKYQVSQRGSHRYEQTLTRNIQVETAFGGRNGCQPIQVVFPSTWPLGLDILKQQYDANAEQRVMAFQSQFFDKMGTTMELRLLGAVGYMTLDPPNVETILSSRFEGNQIFKIVDAAASSHVYL